MKNLISLMICLLIGNSILAQDNITLKSGEEVKSKVLEVTSTEIKYKKFENPEGPTYSILISDVFRITYENGTQDVFNQTQIKEQQPSAASLNSNDDSCTIYIYRQKLFAGSAIGYNLYANDKLIGRIKNGSYFEYRHPAGEVEFWAKTEAKESVMITLEQGKTYYLECSIKFGLAVGRPYLFFVEKFTADQNIAKLNKTVINAPGETEAAPSEVTEIKTSGKSDQTKANYNRPLNISAYFVGGHGFKSSDATISGGGGIGFDVSAGYDFSRSFGITADIGWQQSFGTDESIDAELDFTRWQVLLTPKFLIPINAKNQINLGAGAGLYFSGFTFAYVSANDYASISYSPAFGFHVLCEYKYHINKWLAIGLGAKLTFVTYEADWVSDDIPVSALNDEFKNFKGNGLDGYAGLSINF